MKCGLSIAGYFSSGKKQDFVMNDLKVNSDRGVMVPVMALMFASAVGVLLTGLRVGWTGNIRYLLLVWNLFLAWLPLLFALALCRRCQRGEGNGWQTIGLAALWILFLPNAPYIFTDLIHLNTWFHSHYWIDLSLILMVALTGFLLGFLSLYLMQSVVAHRWGRAAGWGLIAAATGLSGFGIYLGRILRLNSWDAVLHPMRLTGSVGHWVAHPMTNFGTNFVFPVLFGVFLFLGYVMLYALTHLQPGTNARFVARSAE
jgi:uncharacterized membrane protein